MKIRCKNCFKVLEQNEEYCTFCGEHSAQIEKAMKTGNYGPDVFYNLKLCLILFGIIAFFGTGIAMTAFAIITKDATENINNRFVSLIITSVVMFVSVVIINRKTLFDFLFNFSKEQFIKSGLILIMSVVTIVLLSQLSTKTQVLPSYLIKYLNSDNVKYFSFTGVSVFAIVIANILVVVTEEVICRKLLIDALDEGTLLGNISIILISTIVGIVLNFSWVMSVNTLIVMSFINLLSASVYAYTNRSIGLCILFRVIVIICGILIYLI